MTDAAARFAALPRRYFGAILTDVPSPYETWSEKGKGRSAERNVINQSRTTSRARGRASD